LKTKTLSKKELLAWENSNEGENEIATAKGQVLNGVGLWGEGVVGRKKSRG